MTREELNKEIERINAETPIINREYGSDRGYNRVGYYSISKYSGRYGRGYKVCYPNKDGFGGRSSNCYYKVEYLIISK